MPISHNSSLLVLLFSLFQLNNAIKHAQRTEVVVSVEKRNLDSPAPLAKEPSLSVYPPIATPSTQESLIAAGFVDLKVKSDPNNNNTNILVQPNNITA